MPVIHPHIASRSNPRVKQLRAAFAGHARLSGGLVAIEGEHLLFEAMRSGVAIKTIFLRSGSIVPKWTPGSVELVELSGEVFASVVDTQSPQGISALLVPPVWTLADAFPETATAPLVVVAAGLQDPGNLGTLIRSAEAFGATAVLTTPGTVSEWNQKAIRASAGSVFRVPVVEVSVAEVAALKLRGLHLYAAVAGDTLAQKALPSAKEGVERVIGDPRSVPQRLKPYCEGGFGGTDKSVPLTKHGLLAASEANLTLLCALLIGNEGAGLAAEFLEIADTRITIPTPGRVESLNAAIAGSLLLYEAARQRAASLTTDL